MTVNSNIHVAPRDDSATALAADLSENLALLTQAKNLAQSREWDSAESGLLNLARNIAFLRACNKVARGELDWREDAAEHIKIVRAFWPTLSEVVGKQGWFEKALAEARAPVDPAHELHQPETWTKETPSRVGDSHVVLVTFGSTAFRPQQERLAVSAITVGEINEVRLWTSEDLKSTRYYRDHTTLLNRPRGKGYWAWKPFLIFLELSRRAEGDYVVYYDCGRDEGNCITRSVRDLIEWCARDQIGIIPGIPIPIAGSNKLWTKRDCFHFMGCDTPKYWNAPQTMTNLSVWRNSPKARELARQWMAFCLDPRIIADAPNVCGLPNHDGFLDHRHDQSILTNLAMQHGVKPPDYQTPDINGLGIALKQSR